MNGRLEVVTVEVGPAIVDVIVHADAGVGAGAGAVDS